MLAKLKALEVVADRASADASRKDIKMSASQRTGLEASDPGLNSKY